MFVEAVIAGYGKYATFGGRARRAEFWWFLLFTIVVATLARLVDVGMGAPLFEVFAVLMLLLPMLAVTSRRLHDTDRSAWWILVFAIPVAELVVLFLCAQRGRPEPNRYGPAPDTSPVW
jgi:uncharacterized membrane protein YhaH (DUF805 family)